jgi:VWFA-related protein
MRYVCWALLSCLAFVSASSQSAARKAAAGSLSGTDPATLHVSTTAVVVDVVVSDKDHWPIHGLTAADFTVIEDKSPQAIASFEEHIAQKSAVASPRLPPGIFTNFTPSPLNSAVNVLLIDTLNTPLQDQSYLRAQLLKYVNDPRPANSVAIFGLSTKLRMLQGFSSDPEVLRKVVNRQFGKASPILQDQLGGAGVSDSITDIMSAPAGSLMPADVVAAMQTLEDINQSFTLQLRAHYTLDAMNLLGRWLAGIPGRKNVIWFSGSFPIDILPDGSTGANDHFALVADSETEYRQTVDLLARSQVSVYPIDARGIQISPTMSAASSGARYANRPSKGPTAFDRDELKFFETSAAEHSTMGRMAEDTGGKAFYNTNDLTGAVNSAIEDGSNYYTLTYISNQRQTDGDFRKIQFKLDRPGSSLAYRHGYYTDAPGERAFSPPTSSDPSHAAAVEQPTPNTLQRAMVHGVPGSSQILYKLRIAPAAAGSEDKPVPGNALTPGKSKGPYRRYVIDYAADPHDVLFTRTADGGYRGVLQFITLVYTADGDLINAISNTVDATLPEARFKAVTQTGIAFRQEISVPVKGDYSLRVGLYDKRADRIGTTEIPIATVKNLSPLPPPAASENPDNSR